MTEKAAEQALTEFFVQREGEGAMDLIRDVDLVDAGILDSLDFVSLSVFIESRLGRKLDLSDAATFDAMRRYDTLLALIANEPSTSGQA